MAAEKSQPSDLPVHLKCLHEDEELSQERKDLISTLPTESGWIHELHQYNGFWLSKKQLQGMLNCQNHFQAQDSDILLVTPPKAGTTWLKALAFAVLNRKTHYPEHNPTSQLHHHPLLTMNPHDLVPYIDMTLHEDAMPDLISLPPPRLVASHLPYVLLPESVKKSRCKIVYLCRNLKDQFVSMWHFANRLRLESQGPISMEDSFDKFCRGVVNFGPFCDHMLGYYKESLDHPDKIMFLRFEELKDKPDKILMKLAEFIGAGFSKDEENGDNVVVGNILKLCSFDSLSNVEVNKSGEIRHGVPNKVFFRCGEVGDSKNFLTFDMIKRLDEIAEEKLGKYGLKF